MQWPALRLIARLTSSVAKPHLQPGQARTLLTGLFSQKHTKPRTARQAAHREAYGCTWSDEYRQGHEELHVIRLGSFIDLTVFACAAGWRQTMKPYCRT